MLRKTWEYVTKSAHNIVKLVPDIVVVTPVIDYRQHLQRKKTDIEGEREE